MLLDKALRATFRNFSTLFLLAATIIVSAHLIYGFVFRDVLELTELHPNIEELRAGRQVNGVGRADLESAEQGAWIVAGIELVALPLLIGSANRVIRRSERGEIPTVIDALAHPRDSRARLSWRMNGTEIATVGAGTAIAAASWYLAERLGLLMAEPLPDRLNFLAFELARGAALALGATFLVGSVATAAAVAAGRRAALRIPT